ncbi:MAG: glycosyltransferase [Planctomycetota bacterium]|jgi:cellulose synthase/poly-beta-1,6-N-acetylglucosamine synthase-like glycosyltransferase|nr:glycosyltransferase [Planctomycetota bacterium]
MLNNWIHWISDQTPEQILLLFGAILLIDSPRYLFGDLIICLWDSLARLIPDRNRNVATAPAPYLPSVCVLLAGHNESDTLGATLSSIWGTYPKLEIIVIDDGSQDNTHQVATSFAATHQDVMVLRRSRRGGKSSALNFALSYARAEIIVAVDTDSHLGPNAIWEIIQPLRDPGTAAVSAAVLPRNPFTNMLTWLQSYEYFHSTLVGRLFSARLGTLSIVSGAFGAFRRSVLQQVSGWDVGPGEDGDLTLRIRKAGFRVAFAPFAQCFTKVPVTWKHLIQQRRRWDRCVVTYECRKHLDMGYLFNNHNFQIRNFLTLLDRWFFNVFCVYAFFAYGIWMTITLSNQLDKLFLTCYLFYLSISLMQVFLVLFYSINLRRDLIVCLITPLMPFYHVFLKVISLIAITEELLWRRSFQDNFVPVHVRQKTWRW